MLVKGDINKVENRSNHPTWLLLCGILVLLLGATLPRPSFKYKKTNLDVSFMHISTDMEQTDGQYFNAGKYQVKGANLQSSDHSLSGQYSIKLDGKNQYGATVKIKNPSATIYTCEIWKYAPQPVNLNLVATGPSNNDFYTLSNQVVEKKKMVGKKCN